MKTHAPKYCFQGKIYTADRCKTVIGAVKAEKLQLHALARSGYPGRPLLKNQLPGVLSLGFWDADKKQDWGLATHRNEGIEISYLETGGVAFSVDGQQYQLKSGNMTITRSWQPHAWGNPNIGAGRLHWIILDVGVRRPHQKWKWPDWFIIEQKDMKRLTTLLSQNENHVCAANADIGFCFGKIAETIQNTNITFQTSRLAVLINQLFVSILNMLADQNVQLLPELTSAQRTVELFLDEIKESRLFINRDWTIAQMAQECSIGVTNFTKLCKKITNMTPMQYLNHHRVKAAAIMLQKNKNLNITEIAYNCGFSSSQYFATVFRQLKGCSPKIFRKKRL